MRSRQKPPPQARRTRGLSKFKRTDLIKAAKATLAAGLSIRGIDVDPATGRISVLVGPPAAPTDVPPHVLSRVSPHVSTACLSNALIPLVCVDVSNQEHDGGG